MFLTGPMPPAARYTHPAFADRRSDFVDAEARAGSKVQCEAIIRAGPNDGRDYSSSTPLRRLKVNSLMGQVILIEWPSLLRLIPVIAIEQQYQELKTELGFDHFEGRSYPGWQHHVVLTAVAYAFLQRERQRRGADESLTFPGHSSHRARDFHGPAAGATTGLFQTHRRIAAN
jgi:hypothetical protein